MGSPDGYFCPCCRVAASQTRALRIVGHGTYRCQLLGLSDAPEGVVIYVRRFLCLSCGKTMSILPEEVHPRRWYAAAAILAALVRHEIFAWRADKICRSIGAARASQGWRGVGRRSRQLLDSLWFWRAAEPGARGILSNQHLGTI